MSSFGENENMSEGSNYKICKQPEKMDEEEFKPVKIWAGYSLTIVQTEDGAMYQTGGYDGVYGNDKWTKLKFKADKVKQVCAKDAACIVLMTDGTAQYLGGDKLSMSPSGSDCSDFVEVKLIENHKSQEKIAQVAVSIGICTYVTESGKLYVNGLKIKALLDLPESNEMHLPELVTLPENTKAIRAWPGTDWSDKEEKFAVYVELEDALGNKSLWSVGKHMTGQSDKEEVKEFTKVPGLDDVTIADMQLVDNMITLQTTTGQLYGWTIKGEKFNEGTSQPKPLEYVNKLGKVIKYCNAKSHMVVQVEADSSKKLYTIGKVIDGEYKHLGLSEAPKDSESVH